MYVHVHSTIQAYKIISCPYTSPIKTSDCTTCMVFAKHVNGSVILSPCGQCLSQSSVLDCYKCEETNQTNKKVCE